MIVKEKRKLVYENE